MDDSRTRVGPGAPASRNEHCPCGSGQRYKVCCGRVTDADAQSAWLGAAMREALAEQRAGRHEAAHARYAQVLSRAPGLPDALHMFGATQCSIGDHHGALASLADATRRFDGAFTPAVRNLAYVVASHLARIAPGETEARYLRYLDMRVARSRLVGTPAGRVSVIVPSHNHASFIEAALASALDQTRAADEILVIDDGSSDGSVERIRAVAARSSGRIRCFAREHRGAAATINEAIRRSGGDWIAILNSDDRFAHDRLETMLAGVAGARADWGFSRSSCIDAEGNVIPPGVSSGADGLRALQDGVATFDTVGMAFVARNPSISTGALFFSRDLFERVGGFRDLRYTHDWDFCLRAVMHDEPVFVPVPAYDYRAHDANTIARPDGSADAEADNLLRDFYFEAGSARGGGNPYAPLPSVWGRLFYLRVIEGGNAHLLPPGTVERLADELLGRRVA